MKRSMFRHTVPIVMGWVASIFFTTAMACAWDRDTLAMEAKGLPELANILSGRFERQPDLYFEKRLARVTAALAIAPDDFDAYDDAGVAADRLKRGDAAIAWMARKKVVLDTQAADSPKTRDHLYRYHANIGTFYAHRWLRSGATRDSLADLVQARSHIAKAIELNAHAHFGRERYQLMAIEWLVAAPPLVNGVDATLFWPARERFANDPVFPDAVKNAGFKDAIAGLSGLVVLGDAWESIDVFLALGTALQSEDHAGLALLARLRVQELLAQGKRSLHPELPPERLEKLLMPLGQMHQDQVGTTAFFGAARSYAQAWHAHRVGFMATRLQSGKHPDTDADFWQGYAALAGAPEVPDSDRASLAAKQVRIAQAGALLLVLCVTVLVWRRIRRRNSARKRP